MIKNTEFIDKLRSSGLRPTKQRLKICEVLFNREKTFHFTINDLARSISNQLNEKISLATVYNTVHAFKDKGYLKEISIAVSLVFSGGNLIPLITVPEWIMLFAPTAILSYKTTLS